MGKSFEVLEVSGTHQDLGMAIGEKFRDKIQLRMALRREKIPNYDLHLDECGPYLKMTQQYFPELITELEGMAAAAGVPFRELFFHNCREVFDFFYHESEWDEERPEKNPTDHCTIAVSFGERGAVVGHNEDWLAEAVSDYYVLKAKLGEVEFVVLAADTILPGDAAGMNNFGLVQCINELHCQRKTGVPKNFVARAVLEAKSLEEARRIITLAPQASGFNHIVVAGQSGINVEIAGERLEVQEFNTTFVHTNHYLSPSLAYLEEYHTVSSEKRLERARELLSKKMKVLEMEKLLSDRKDKEHPICQEDKTLGSLVFDTEKKEVWIARGHPCGNEFKKYLISD